MIFLSAGIPTPTPIVGREFFGKGNVPAIREAVMAFTKVCMEYHIPICFGGHPAISPLVYDIAKDYGNDFSKNVLIYQSEKFRGKTPKEVSYYDRLKWTPEAIDIPLSVSAMRDEMFKNSFSCGVFIGGMDGIIDEAKRFRVANPKSDMIVVPNTGGASKVLSERTGFDFIVLPDSYAYVSEFKKLLKNYKKNGI
ncbi:MAG TPA: hypothetical protein DCW90_11530 [Lachnospiraceae bacterium]|nr:hypothetical protein [Lachnospiraceae bacterium]